MFASKLHSILFPYIWKGGAIFITPPYGTKLHTRIKKHGRQAY